MNDLEQTICRKRMKKMYQSRNMRTSGGRSEKSTCQGLFPNCYSEFPHCYSNFPHCYSDFPNCYSDFPQCYSDIALRERKNFRLENIKIFFFSKSNHIAKNAQLPCKIYTICFLLSKAN